MAKSTKQTKKRPKKRNRFRTIVVLFCVIVAISLALAGAIAYVRHHDAPLSDPKLNGLTVQSITVFGNTQYDDNAIIGESGLKVGQSVFSVNKGAAAKKIKALFPYVKEVQMKSPSFNTIEIHITETPVIGAMYGAGQWLIVGDNGKILETMDLQSDTPGRYFYLQGAMPNENIAIGETAMDERSVRIVTTVLNALETYKMEGILGIDLRSKTSIELNWKNTLTIDLGNETNLDGEIALLSKAMPQILQKNGGALSGRLDLSSYSDTSEDNDKIIYTPQEVLDSLHPETSTTTTTAPSGDTSAGTTTTTTTQGAGGQ